MAYGQGSSPARLGASERIRRPRRRKSLSGAAQGFEPRASSSGPRRPDDKMGPARTGARWHEGQRTRPARHARFDGFSLLPKMLIQVVELRYDADARGADQASARRRIPLLWPERHVPPGEAYAFISSSIRRDSASARQGPTSIAAGVEGTRRSGHGAGRTDPPRSPDMGSSRPHPPAELREGDPAGPLGPVQTTHASRVAVGRSTSSGPSTSRTPPPAPSPSAAIPPGTWTRASTFTERGNPGRLRHRPVRGRAP